MKAYMNWSGGKDSALALYYALQRKDLEVKKLLTNINAVHNRVSMHGVRRSLLVAQAEAIGLPLDTIELPEQPSMPDYEKALFDKTVSLKDEGYTKAIFGDIFLEDLKQYREKQMAEHGIECIFPLWKKDTRKLLKEFLQLGFKTIIVCINSSLLDASYCGKIIDEMFIGQLPENIDCCGENGEFHTFVFDGPIFKNPVAFSKGEIVFREYLSPKSTDDCFTISKPVMGFHFCDLLPAPDLRRTNVI